MAGIGVSFLLEKLGDFLAKEVRLLEGTRREVEDIEEELESIRAFLKGADGIRHGSEGNKAWVNQIRRVAYEVEDAIDEFVLRFGKRKDGGRIINSFTTLFSAGKQLPPRLHLAHSIKKIKGSIAKISERKDRYDIPQTIDPHQRSGANTRSWKEAKFLEVAKVVGIESKVEELMNQLVARTGKGRKTFISVYGMPGVGKSTLARKVFEDLKSKKHFNCFAWLSVSQSFETKALLKCMLKEFGNIREHSSSEKAQESTLPSQGDVEKMEEPDLNDRVQKHLQGKRFILVLDDVWDKTVCTDINLALPENSNGSKILITTCIQSLASELEAENMVSIPHELKSLSDGAAEELLRQKAFGGSAINPEVSDVFKSMVRRCGGLPLAIVALGGILLQKKTREEWEMVNDRLSQQVANYELSSKNTTIRSNLKLSYDKLPFHLKPCFLYCALFPEDHLIKRNKLIRLWVAEGFVTESDDGKTKEKIGEEWLMQLISRSMLQVAGTSFDGSRVRSCRLHCLMRDLAISISQEEGFSSKLDKQGRNENAFKPRRVSVIGDGKENGMSAIPDLKFLRSLLFFNLRKGRTPDPILYLKLKLLRVLDLEHVGIKELPEAIGQLLHLRYLSLYRNYYLKHLPGSIGSLEMLETLDIRRTEIGELPSGIVRLKKLRHLCMRLDTQVPKGISSLSSLQTFIGVACSRKGIGAEIGMLKELRRLTVSGVKGEDVEEVYAAIRGLTHLFRLRIQPAQSNLALPFGKTLEIPDRLRILTLGGLSQLPDKLGSFNNLIRLTLGEGSLKIDPFPPLSSFRSLLHLDLRGLDNVEVLQCAPRGFLKLQRLELSSLKGLKTVTLEEGSMPILTRLVIKNCPTLQMVPHGIQHLALQELELHDMPEGFIKRLEEAGEDRSKVQHIPLIRVFASMN